MWIDRKDTRKVIGRIATKLGHATLTDRKNAMHVSRYLKGVQRVMTVKGEIFEEDLLKLAHIGAVYVQADADWGGDKTVNRQAV